MPVSPQQVEQYHRHGYIAVRQAIGHQTLAALRDVLAAQLDRSRGISDDGDVFLLEDGHCAAAPRLRRINHPVAVDPLFWEIATSADVLDCVEALLGPNIRYHHSKLNFKAGDGGARVGWHQDFAFFPHTNYDVLACAIPLADSTPANGCLMVIPGTHRGRILDHRDDARQFVGEITETSAIDERAAVAVALAAGDMSIHHACLVHGSAANRSAQPRPLLIFEYAACDAVPLDYRPPANEFSGRVVRGCEATHARLAGAVSLPLRGSITGARSIFERQSRRA